MRCPTCGAEVKPGLTMCPWCGATVRRIRLLFSSISIEVYPLDSMQRQSWQTRRRLQIALNRSGFCGELDPHLCPLRLGVLATVGEHHVVPGYWSTKRSYMRQAPSSLMGPSQSTTRTNRRCDRSCGHDWLNGQQGISRSRRQFCRITRWSGGGPADRCDCRG